MRPVLAPGVRVLRRSSGDLQVGIVAGRRVVLPDTDPVRRTLGRLSRGETLAADPDTDRVLALLAPVLVEGGGMGTPGVAPGDLAAAALLDPLDYPTRVARRRDARIGVDGTLGAGDPLPLLTAAGLGTADRGDRDRTAVLVLRVGEVDRDHLDPLVRAGLPHLLVRLVEGEALVGPFVAPGRTACVRCLDAHRVLDAPETPVLAAQHARARDERRDGVPEPVDSALATLATAWAVRDLVTHADGGQPSTWSATVHLTATLAAVTRTDWLRHPACGCNWLLDDLHSRTMVG